MKFIAILLLCAWACFVRSESEITGEEVAEIIKKCKEENEATDEDVAAMLNKEPATGTAAKCFRACMMKNLEILDDNGKFLKEGAVKLAKLMAEGDAEKETAIKEAIDACVDIEVSEDHCEAAEEYGECLLKETEAKITIEKE